MQCFILADLQVLQARGADASMGDDPGSKQPEKLEKDRMEELGGAGVYSLDMWKKAMLEDPSWKCIAQCA
eukprot:5904898-Amphidinium_carterae.2